MYIEITQSEEHKLKKRKENRAPEAWGDLGGGKEETGRRGGRKNS